jgi:branched-chain amino acid transport system substrate-binding protein
VVLDYQHAYEARYHQDVSTFGGHAYDGLMLIVQAMKNAGTTDDAKVRDALEHIHGFMGIDGEFNFSPTDHMGLSLAAFRMLEIQNGNWTLVR